MNTASSVQDPQSEDVHLDPLQRGSAPGLLTAAGCAACDAADAHVQGVMSSASPNFIYALGRIQPRVGSSALEKELAQTMGRSGTDGLTDTQALIKTLSDRKNRYLARHICWVLTIEQMDSYILVPRDPADYELLIEAVRPRPSPADIDAIVGVQGPLASPERCNGLAVPLVIFEQVYSFDRTTLVQAIPKPKKSADEKFAATAETVLDRIMQLADNGGSTDEHRALNYLSLRYPGLYALVAELLDRNFALASVDVRPSRLSAGRRIVDCIFGFRNRATDVVEAYFIRVDVTELFPFLVSKVAPYFSR